MTKSPTRVLLGKLNMLTPWGRAEETRNVSEGVDWVFTSGHGGLRIKSSALRNAGKLELAKKSKNFGVGIYRSHAYYYEEDCGWSIGVLLMPEAFDEKKLQRAREVAKNWYPEEYTMVTGEEVQLEESSELRKRDFEEKTKNRFVVLAAWSKTSMTPDIPEGCCKVKARRESDGKEFTTILTKEEYRAKREEFEFASYVFPEGYEPTEHVSYGRRQLPSMWEENLERRIRTNFCRS